VCICLLLLVLSSSSSFSRLCSLFTSYHSARCTVCSHLTIQHAVQSVHILPFSTLYNLFTSYHSARCTVCSHLIIQHAVQSVHIFLRSFINYIIFFLQLCLSFQSSSTNPFSPIGYLIPSAQVSLGLLRFLLPGGRHFICSLHRQQKDARSRCRKKTREYVRRNAGRFHPVFRPLRSLGRVEVFRPRH
jgi:hypothetical protein